MKRKENEMTEEKERQTNNEERKRKINTTTKFNFKIYPSKQIRSSDVYLLLRYIIIRKNKTKKIQFT